MKKTKNKLYSVPVFFNVSGTGREDARLRIEEMLEQMEQHDQLPPFYFGEILAFNPTIEDKDV